MKRYKMNLPGLKRTERVLADGTRKMAISRPQENVLTLKPTATTQTNISVIKEVRIDQRTFHNVIINFQEEYCEFELHDPFTAAVAAEFVQLRNEMTFHFNGNYQGYYSERPAKTKK
ncbi:hypothetical protein [Paenisporosarcina cavernae]|uniref:Uncharacterized protein n=1 Tax=Paenisporosarcina cavernae TaxID=2320858 RepID=A0A385YQ45_9BACL|nr:hypothetical protein [Paenisporosarcina cavernae]AYC28855.1 hypothetical protein D3873_02825 [Paenisporosarcina cavernae]